jgi:hypothetical protein
MGKAIILPESEEMLERLMKVNDNPHAKEQLYPILMKEAGSRLVAQGVVMILTLAIADYAKGVLPIVARRINLQFSDFIDALITDPEVAEEAKEFHKMMIS